MASSRRSTSFLLALLVALVSTLATPAFAQSNDVERARELFQEGNAAYRERNWNQAYERFKESFNLSPTYDCAGNLGDVELMLEKPRDAAEHLAYSLRHWPAGQAEARAKTAGRLNEAKQKIASVKVVVNKSGAEIFVNNTSVGTSPLEGELFVDPGAITVEARADGKIDKSTIALDKGGSRTVKLTLGEGGGAAANGTEPNGNGGSNGADPPPKSMVPVYIGGAVAAIGLVGAIVFEIGRSSDASDADDLLGKVGPNGCGSGTPFVSDCTALKDANKSADNNELLRNIGIGVFAAGAATAVIWLLLPAPKHTSVRVSPFVSRTDGGLGFSGAF